ncbi:hypothetical protein DSO57_1017558 [Entomophthora muscae]|uniref:Uncharacterized protein n=1 Tax=Entomophthora muscae TaxID=34485 RepID=A0ACC2SU47_9FUNG|nr:hypothetical protein DSO57_1017558 [Entomophthora muscae]
MDPVCPEQAGPDGMSTAIFIAEISIQLTHNADTWCDKWHKEHAKKNWDTFKQDFLARFVLKDTALMITRQVKNLTQTGTMKELTHAYEELQLCAPSDMAFDTPATHLMYYDALKLHVMRHLNLDQVTNLQSLYCEAEKAEQSSNALHKACHVWLLGTTSRRTQQEIFITKDLRFKASLGLAFRAKLRAHTLISWKTRCKNPFNRKDRKKLEDY